tara:strand:- start:3593 stop:3760 length:168 start_codon:yes stop_codon:yes gene_type:complete
MENLGTQRMPSYRTTFKTLHAPRLSVDGHGGELTIESPSKLIQRLIDEKLAVSYE